MSMLGIDNTHSALHSRIHVNKTKEWPRCRHAYVSAEAATLLFAIMWRNTANKAKVAAKGTCAALVKRIIRHWNMADEESIHCVERLCIALASLLLYKANHEKMIGG